MSSRLFFACRNTLRYFSTKTAELPNLNTQYKYLSQWTWQRFTTRTLAACNDAGYINHVQHQLSWTPPPDWARRFIWKLFLFIKHERVYLTKNGDHSFFELSDVLPTDNGMELGLHSLSRDVQDMFINVPWRGCNDVSGHGVYLDPLKPTTKAFKFLPC